MRCVLSTQSLREITDCHVPLPDVSDRRDTYRRWRAIRSRHALIPGLRAMMAALHRRAPSRPAGTSVSTGAAAVATGLTAASVGVLVTMLITASWQDAPRQHLAVPSPRPSATLSLPQMPRRVHHPPRVARPKRSPAHDAHKPRSRAVMGRQQAPATAPRARSRVPGDANWQQIAERAGVPAGAWNETPQRGPFAAYPEARTRDGRWPVRDRPWSDYGTGPDVPSHDQLGEMPHVRGGLPGTRRSGRPRLAAGTSRGAALNLSRAALTIRDCQPRISPCFFGTPGHQLVPAPREESEDRSHTSQNFLYRAKGRTAKKLNKSCKPPAVRARPLHRTSRTSPRLPATPGDRDQGALRRYAHSAISYCHAACRNRAPRGRVHRRQPHARPRRSRVLPPRQCEPHGSLFALSPGEPSAVPAATAARRWQAPLTAAVLAAFAAGAVTGILTQAAYAALRWRRDERYVRRVLGEVPLDLAALLDAGPGSP